MTLNEIMKTLIDNGYQAYIVGGAVRDKLLGYDGVNDYDLTTDALPEKVVELFDGASLVSANFSTAVYVPSSDHGVIEISTMRAECEYEDGKPTEIAYVDDILIDLARRDATCNAIAQDINGNLIDPFGGVNDIDRGILVPVGNPDVRIAEHPIRLMRYIRMASAHKLVMEDTLARSISKNAELIVKESWDAIGKELMKGLSAKPAMYIMRLKSHGILAYILPEVAALVNLKQNRHHRHVDAYTHTLRCVWTAEKLSELHVLAALLHDIGKAETAEFVSREYGYSFHSHEAIGARMADSVCRRFGIGADDRMMVTTTVLLHMSNIESTKAARRFINRVDACMNFPKREDLRDAVLFVVDVMIADRMAKSNGADNGTATKYVCDVLDSKLETSIADLSVNGRDIMERLGIRPGRIVGDILKYLLDMLIEEKISNEKEDLLDGAERYYSSIQESNATALA